MAQATAVPAQPVRFQNILSNIFSGTISGVIRMVYTISLGSLIFSGDLAGYTPYGLGIALMTSIAMIFTTTLFSQIPGVISGIQSAATVIITVMAANLAATTAQPDERFGVIMAAIACAALLTGGVYWAVGAFKLGRLMRFIPYPVVGGFLAGTGWLLVKGSVGVMTTVSLSTANFAKLALPAQSLRWGIGLAFAIAAFVWMKRVRHNLALPIILTAGMAVFYIGLFISGLPIEDAMQRGLLLGKSAGQVAWQPVSLSMLSAGAAHWRDILGQSSNLGIILFISLVSLLLNISGVELALRQDIDLNRELKVAGLANIISGLLGGAVGFHTIGETILSYRMGARNRLPGLAAGTFCVLVMLAGARLLAYFPRPILGGTLLYLGIDFMWDWIATGWKRLPRLDYAVVVTITVVIAATDFLVGVGVGLVAMVFLFVVNYSRVSVIAHAYSGADIHSNVERCSNQQHILSKVLGQHTAVLELHGFIFFGTANSLLDDIRRRALDPALPPLRFALLDFRRITGMDSSAVLSFVKARQLAEGQGFTLLLTHLSPAIQRALEIGGLFGPTEAVRVFPDLDRGLEYAEERLLALAAAPPTTPATLEEQFADSGLPPAVAARLRPYLERMELAPGECIICQGQASHALYFIESGAVSVYLDSGEETTRIRTLRLGTTVGELSFMLETMPTASVIADTPAIAYRLTHQALSDLECAAPDLAVEFHRYLACILAERVVSTTRTLEAVLR
jgi:SulP family sulfate permease